MENKNTNNIDYAGLERRLDDVLHGGSRQVPDILGDQKQGNKVTNQPYI